MSTAKVIMVTGALGVLTSIGYAVVRSREPRAATDHQVDATMGLELPLAEPDHPRLRVRINDSHTRHGIVQQGAMQLLQQAVEHDPEVDLDELTGARLAASEHASGTFTELVCIVDAEVNRAQGKGTSLFASVTHESRFGKQGGKRPASTRRDPQMRHLLASRAVIRGPARGISRGATRFYDPEAMQVMHRRYRQWLDGGRKGKKPAIVSCDAFTLLEAWSFDFGRKGKSRCPPDRSRTGRHPLAWVGPIPGVDPLRLLLMKPMPVGDEHQHMYEAARDVLVHGLGEG